MESIDVFAPLASLQWVDRNTIHANDYNPNKVSEENLKLLVQSILTNGWPPRTASTSRRATATVPGSPTCATMQSMPPPMPGPWAARMR